MTTDSGTRQDLRAYLTKNGPLPPHRTALLVASLAEQIAVAHAEGSAYREIGPEIVYVTGPGPQVGVSLLAQLIPRSDAAAASNVRAVGDLLAWLLGATLASARSEGAPQSLRRLVE